MFMFAGILWNGSVCCRRLDPLMLQGFSGTEIHAAGTSKAVSCEPETACWIPASRSSCSHGVPCRRPWLLRALVRGSACWQWRRRSGRCALPPPPRCHPPAGLPSCTTSQVTAFTVPAPSAPASCELCSGASPAAHHCTCFLNQRAALGRLEFLPRIVDTHAAGTPQTLCHRSLHRPCCTQRVLTCPANTDTSRRHHSRVPCGAAVVGTVLQLQSPPGPMAAMLASVLASAAGDAGPLLALQQQAAAATGACRPPRPLMSAPAPSHVRALMLHCSSWRRFFTMHHGTLPCPAMHAEG